VSRSVPRSLCQSERMPSALPHSCTRRAIDRPPMPCDSLRSALNFIKFLVEKLIECEMGPDGKPVEVDGKPKRKMNTLSTCIQHGYDNSLRPHHGMVVRGTFAVASKAAGVMGRESFLKKLDESDEAACASLEGMVADFGYVQDINDKFVREKGLETTK